jgi:hypothetical protein
MYVTRGTFPSRLPAEDRATIRVNIIFLARDRLIPNYHSTCWESSRLGVSGEEGQALGAWQLGVLAPRLLDDVCRGGRFLSESQT